MWMHYGNKNTNICKKIPQIQMCKKITINIGGLFFWLGMVSFCKRHDDNHASRI
jgi:hypothetical protein